MGIARSSYYAAPAADADAALVAEMRAITDVWECYGYRRIGAELRHRGWVVNGKKVRRLMKQHAGLQSFDAIHLETLQKRILPSGAKLRKINALGDDHG